MKKTIIYLSMLFLITCVYSCGDDLNKNNSIFDDTIIKEQNSFDKWLDKYFIKPYNISVYYNYIDIQSNYNYDLVPADLERSKILSYAARYLWIEAYEEHMGGAFFRSYAPRVLHYIGNPGWNSNNTITMGEAQGGLRISFFAINRINLTDPNSLMTGDDNYIRTMHHEYAHIFQQKKVTDPAFDKITPEAYNGDSWNSRSKAVALRLGLITPYAGKAPREDFVDLYSVYVCETPAQWDARLLTASTNADGTPSDGRRLIEQKFEIVFNFYKESWGIDLNEMRDIINRRKKDVTSMDFLYSLYK